MAFAFLGAIAFEMFCGQGGDGRSEPIYVVDENLQAFLNRAFDRLWNSGAYKNVRGRRIESETNLWNEWTRLKQMNSEGLRYMLLSSSGAIDPRQPKAGERILFADASTQAFFAAYWAANWSGASERAILRGWFPDPIIA